MKWVGFSAIAALVASAASADAPHKLAYMATIEGTCSDLTVADMDRTGDCPEYLLNTAYQDNYSSFKLTVGDGLVVSFFGYDHEAHGDVAHLSIERILVTPTPRKDPGDNLPALVEKARKATQDMKATGDCEYSNPDLPDSHVNCEAIADGKTYRFKFHPTKFEIIR